jgi:hypothetical protein
MKLRISALAAALALGAFATNPVPAHEGALDANGCHYEHKNGNYHCHKEVPPNPDRNAPVKKSRENVCHDRSSPNYRQLRFFVAYRNMAECVSSGGHEAMNDSRGLSNRF